MDTSTTLAQFNDSTAIAVEQALANMMAVTRPITITAVTRADQSCSEANC
jgi:hypothetical protein